MATGGGNIFLRIIDGLVKQSKQRSKIIESGREHTSVWFTVRAIIVSLLSAACTVLAGLAFGNGMRSNNPIVAIALVISALVLIVSALLLLISALASAINQLRLNRKAIGFIALFVVIILLVGSLILGIKVIE